MSRPIEIKGESEASMTRFKSMADAFDLMVVEQMEKDMADSEKSEELRNNVFSDDVLKRIWDHYGVIL